MSTTSPTTPPPAPVLPPPFDVLATLPLVETNGVAAYSPWHRMAINLLIETLQYRWRDRDDFFVGGNMFIYYSVDQVRNRRFLAPAFFFATDVERHRERLWWATWSEEGHRPRVIIDILSPNTAARDQTETVNLYESIFRVAEYFQYDPTTNELKGWRYQSIPPYGPIPSSDHGRLWSLHLEAWLGTWTGPYQETPGTWIRFFNETGELLPTRTEAEKQRADKAEVELERLRRGLDALRQRPS